MYVYDVHICVYIFIYIYYIHKILYSDFFTAFFCFLRLQGLLEGNFTAKKGSRLDSLSRGAHTIHLKNIRQNGRIHLKNEHIANFSKWNICPPIGMVIF